MTDPVPAKPDPDAHLPQPPHGGSFVRQADGSLLMVDGAVEKPNADAEPEPEPEPAPAPASAPAPSPADGPLELSPADKLPADPIPEQPAKADEQHEG